MVALGIDLGGTKLEAQLFDADWACRDLRRISTAKTYSDLVSDITDLVLWADRQAGQRVPVGLGTAGLINPRSGIMTAANLPSHGKGFAKDLARATHRPVTIINDCQAMALSEAVFGAGRDFDTMCALVLGTGVSGAYVAQGVPLLGHTHVAGEIGHIAAPAHLVQEFGLPLVTCGCGQIGCFETLISGAGLSRIAATVLGHKSRPEELVDLRQNDKNAQRVWKIWCALTAELIKIVTRTLDPACFVLGGGLSKIEGVTDDLTSATAALEFAGFDTAPIVLADGGDTSGARGAAYAALTSGRQNV